MKFSHSSLSDYIACPRMYKLKRIDKIRPIKTGSPLSFGGALDSASETILLRYKKELSEDEKSILSRSPMELYLEAMEPYRESLEVKYSTADLQEELLTEEDWEEVKGLADENGLAIENYSEFVADCRAELKKNIMGLDSNMEMVYNRLCWFSLKRKAELLLPLLETWCEENIVEVHAIQEKISLEDGEDEIIGLLDFEATLQNGERRIIDLKTASKAYGDDEANNSQQLTIYSEHKENSLVAFLVLEKKIRKRDPRARIQYVQGEITENTRDEVFGKITEAVEAIKNEKEWDKNTDSCYRYGKCDYYDLCKYGSMNGLKKRE